MQLMPLGLNGIIIQRWCFTEMLALPKPKSTCGTEGW